MRSYLRLRGFFVFDEGQSETGLSSPPASRSHRIQNKQTSPPLKEPHYFRPAGARLAQWAVRKQLNSAQGDFMNRLEFILFILAGLVGLTRASLASAIPEDPSQVYIQSVSLDGTGCPPGAVSSLLSSDGQLLSLLFDAYTAKADANVRLDQKQCEINLSFHVPPGWSFSLNRADFRGFAAVDSGAVAVLSASYVFPGQPVIRACNLAQNDDEEGDDENNFRRRFRRRYCPPAMLRRDRTEFRQKIFNGPFNQEYEQSDELPLDNWSWSHCDFEKSEIRVLKIRTAVSARVLGSLRGIAATISLDSLDAKTHRQDFGIKWHRCGVSPIRRLPVLPVVRRILD